MLMQFNLEWQMKKLDLLGLDHFHFGKEYMIPLFQVETMNNAIYVYD